jgi:flavin-dependent dehydrogenase
VQADVDIVVAGGGPVGLAVAIEARLLGMSVVVCEPRPAPVDKACGEGLMPGAVRALERLGVQPAGRAFAGIRYVDDVRAAEHRFRSGPGLGVRRTVLHDAMTRRASELGVETVPVAVREPAHDSMGVTVVRELRGRWLLACDGLNSGLRRSMGLTRPTGGVRRYGVRRHFQVEPWSEFVEVHWTSQAELYVTPVADDLVGVAVLAERGVDFDAVLASAVGVAVPLANANVASSLRGAGPLHQRTFRRVAGRVMLVGDAAGYVDALTGEGIALGLAQARAAVSAIAADDPLAYERAWPQLTRDYRVLTGCLLRAASRPALRRGIVPLAARLPRVYGAIVDRLAG